jgi:hypothetical protein
MRPGGAPSRMRAMGRSRRARAAATQLFVTGEDKQAIFRRRGWGRSRGGGSDASFTGDVALPIGNMRQPRTNATGGGLVTQLVFKTIVTTFLSPQVARLGTGFAFYARRSAARLTIGRGRLQSPIRHLWSSGLWLSPGQSPGDWNRPLETTFPNSTTERRLP